MQVLATPRRLSSLEWERQPALNYLILPIGWIDSPVPQPDYREQVRFHSGQSQQRFVLGRTRNRCDRLLTLHSEHPDSHYQMQADLFGAVNFVVKPERCSHREKLLLGWFGQEQMKVAWKQSTAKQIER